MKTLMITFILGLSFFNGFFIKAIAQDDLREILRQRIENLTDKQSMPDEKIFNVVSISDFYENNDFSFVWNGYRIRRLLYVLKNSPNEGLHPADYHYMFIEALNREFPWLSEEEKVLIELYSTDAFLQYTKHILSGKIESNDLSGSWNIPRTEQNPLDLFNKALRLNNIDSVLLSLTPDNEVYLGLQQGLEKYREIHRNGGWEKLDINEKFTLDSYGEEIAKIKMRLIVSEDLELADTGCMKLFDYKLLNAIEKFQGRHGIEISGELNEITVNALNVNVEDRINQIRINMERWRWLPQELGDYFILVNIANFSLEVVEGMLTERTHKIIVGLPYRKTPVFSAAMSYLVFNPTWTIPPNILRNDILPSVRKSVKYLSRKNIIVYDHNNEQIDPSTIDWGESNVTDFKYRQIPGPGNSLGRVKFMFPNNYNVYIHDTPSLSLFQNSERTFSSGCIRVENALDLATYLLSKDQEWTPEMTDEIMKSGKTKTIKLERKPDVYILYWTAWSDGKGIVHFRRDIYDRDSKILKLLDEPLKN